MSANPRPRPPTKDYIFSPEALLQLLCHYTDGTVPMNGLIKEILVHPQMVRKIGILVESQEWINDDPLFLGYDGKRTMSWSKSQGGDPIWEQKAETPTRQ